MVKWIFRSLNGLLLIACAVTTLFPLVHILATSLSGSAAVLAGRVLAWPVDWTTQAYINLLESGQLTRAMWNTVVITVAGTLMQMIGTSLAAYSLSKRRLGGRSWMLVAILFTMLFSNGLIPMFLLLKQLSLLDTYWAIWLPGLISAYNLFVMKSFFEGMPGEIEESAAIDGASDPVIFIRLILPLSKPILAAISLFYAVGLWNVYAQALYFLTSSTKFPLMVKLYQMIRSTDPSLLDANAVVLLAPESLKAASIIIAVSPILCVYPFLQKYFVKGVLLGSIKG